MRGCTDIKDGFFNARGKEEKEVKNFGNLKGKLEIMREGTLH